MNSNHYTGHTLSLLDGKGRLSVPARFRDVMVARSGTKERMIIEAHPDLPCLVGSDIERHRHNEQQLAQKFGGVDSLERDLFAADMFGLNAEIPIEDTGRILLPANWRETGRLTDEVLFLGLGEKFLIIAVDLALEHIKHRALPGIVAEWRRKRQAEKRGGEA